jgi:hypothetical protein
MNQKAINIINWLANDSDYFEGLSILQQNGNPPKGILQTITRRENPFNRAKLTYLLIKDLNDLTGLSFTEQNYREMIKPYISKEGKELPTSTKNGGKQILILDPNSEIKGTIEETNEIPDGYLPKRMSDKEYAKWFYQQPDKIQELLKEMSRLTRLRAKLHKDCREIKGNSQDAIGRRKPILDEIDEISSAIKNIYAITENFKISGEISENLTENKTDKKDDFDFSSLSDLQKKHKLDDLKISIRRNKNDYKNEKLKTSNKALKLKERIEIKEKQIQILEEWYATTK